MLKHIITIVYIALIVIMGTATIVEKFQGTEMAMSQIYGSWWFCALWGILTACGLVWIAKRRMRRPCLLTLHLSLVVILCGALITHLQSQEGMLHLREGEKSASYVTKQGMIKQLPFAVKLKRFELSLHEGTSTPSDYISHITVSSASDSTDATVSMNNIYSAKGVRLYQSSYDDDTHGSYLHVSIDPWGVPITYIGYALLFISLIWMLFDPKGTFRKLLSSKEFRRTASIAMLTLAAMHGHAAPTMDKDAADALGKLYIDYNGRICQLQTYALDFTKKLSGKRSYNGLTAEQVLSGFIFYGEQWNAEPVIRVKSGPLKSKLQLPDHVSFNSFFNSSGYILAPILEESMRGENDKLHREAVEYDDKLMLIAQLRQGQPLKLFPFASKTNGLKWLAPNSTMPTDMEAERGQYIHDILQIMSADMAKGDKARVMESISKIQKYQYTYGGSSIPAEIKTNSERIYNKVPFATILFMLNLTMAILSLFIKKIPYVTMIASWLALTLCIALRWIVSGTIPMSNGYETMLLMAWIIELVAIVMTPRIRIMLTFGFLTSGLFLLVSHIGQMNPQITHIMPVLNSPLLSIHVSVIMLAYALLSLTFACGVTALVMKKRAEYLQKLSMLFLHPSITALGIGIFTGAIWANISWGTYWSWDPKEVWALITLMVYAVAVHQQSFSWLKKPTYYHLYMVFAFLTLLMTYFGVNYFLGGMHSYA